MRYLTKEEIHEAMHNPKKFSPEEKKRAKQLGEKMKQLSYEERRAMRMREAEENGHL